MAVLFPWQKKAKEDGSESLEITLPEEMQKNLNKALENGEKLSKIDELVAGLASIQARFSKEDEEKDAARRRAQAEQSRKASEETDEEIEQLMITDPTRATALLVKKQTDPHAAALMTLRADQMRRELFEDTEKFQYYTGEFKSEVDKLLAGQTLAARNDPGVIENAYWTTLGKHTKEIAEGKLKNRFASSEGSRGTSGGDLSKGSGNVLPEITDDVRKVAKMMGMKAEDYAKMLQEEGIGYA